MDLGKNIEVEFWEQLRNIDEKIYLMLFYKIDYLIGSLWFRFAIGLAGRIDMVKK